jgi:hypothetical protein
MFQLFLQQTRCQLRCKEQSHLKRTIEFQGNFLVEVIILMTLIVISVVGKSTRPNKPVLCPEIAYLTRLLKPT